MFMQRIPVNAIPIRRPREIIPKEAYRVAEMYTRAADEAANLASLVQLIETELVSSWEGNSKDTYFRDYDHLDRDLQTLSEELRHYASEIEHMTVTIYETVYLVDGKYIIE